MRYVTPGSFERRLAAGLVETESGCIEWTKAKTPHGYGRIGRGARGQGWAFTHRAAWELARGEIPSGMFVCHRCDNPPCCNVNHLFLGTHADNMADMWSKNRQGGQIPAGEAHPDARLSDEDVREIRRLAPLVGNHAEIGRRFGISKQHARAIALGQKRGA